MGLLLSAGHADRTPSQWVRRWLHLLRPGGTVLDVACGQGRHLRWLAGLGFRGTGVDRDEQALSALADLGVERVVADIESGPWPLPGRQFDAVIVTNYLWRPLWARLRQSLEPNGVLIVETFARGQETVGRPRRAEFLLAPGELWAAAEDLRVLAYEDGFLDSPERYVQRIVAVAEAAAPGPPPRYRLQ